jgi:hypothetical protein
MDVSEVYEKLTFDDTLYKTLKQWTQPNESIRTEP